MLFYKAVLCELDMKKKNYATWTKFVRFCFLRYRVCKNHFTWLVQQKNVSFCVLIALFYYFVSTFCVYIFIIPLTFDVKALARRFCIVIQLGRIQNNFFLHEFTTCFTLIYVYQKNVHFSIYRSKSLAMKVESGLDFFLLFFNVFFFFAYKKTLFVFFLYLREKEFFVMHIQPQTVKYYL